MELLHSWGILGVTLDLDNTIVPWHTTFLTPPVREWVRGLKAAQIRVCLLTNNYSPHVAQVANELNVPIVSAAFKPLPAGFRRSLQQMGVAAGAALAIGDQLFTDVLGAKLAGMRAIVVKPIGKREFPTTRILRLLESPVYALLRRRSA